MPKMLALTLCGLLTACAATTPSSPAICERTSQNAADLNKGLLSNPDTADDVARPAVGLIITLSGACG